MGFQKEAEASLRLAEQISVAELGEMNMETAGYQTNLALALLSRGEVEGAENLLRRAKFVVESTGGTPGNELAMIEAELSAVALTRKKLGTAADEAKKALEIFSRQKFPDARGVALAQVSLADVHLRANQLSEAEQYLALAIPNERRNAPQSRLLADGLRRLAQLRALQGRYKESQEIYREVISLYELRVGAQHPAMVPLLREYADTLKRDGAPKAEIRGVESRAKSIGSPAAAGFAPQR
jgi:tetratricopeptide (TPR) repeat protein